MNRFGMMSILAAMVFTATACTELGQAADRALNGPPPTTTVVLFDESRSIDPRDRELYLASILALGEGLVGGDRVLIAPIGDQTQGTFRPVFDLRVERTSVRLDQEDRIAAAGAQLKAKAPGLLAGGQGAMNTRIIEAIKASTEVFTLTPESQRRIVLLTDACEYSAVIDLERTVVPEETVRRALAKAKEQGLLPDLTNVELSIIGAGCPDYRGTERFWRAYAAQTRANLLRYGRLPYEPAP